MSTETEIEQEEMIAEVVSRSDQTQLLTYQLALGHITLEHFKSELGALMDSARRSMFPEPEDERSRDERAQEDWGESMHDDAQDRGEVFGDSGVA